RDQLKQYESVRIQVGEMTDIQPDGEHFTVTLADGSRQSARRILLAMGMKDTLPPLAGLDHFWGTSAFHCPYCDGWEQRDKLVALYGRGDQAIHVAKLLRVLTDDLVICTDGATDFNASQQALLTKHNIRVIETPVSRLDGRDGQLEQVVFADGSTLARASIFVRPVVTQHSDIAARLGCEMTPNGLVKVDQQGRTTVAGIYAAGDMAHPFRQVGVAAAQGAMTGVGINSDIVAEDFAE
ncbi:MAG: NAD(P)/FAD-dependent oxidoreductase, partial [Chloroflexota bacterium]